MIYFILAISISALAAAEYKMHGMAPQGTQLLIECEFGNVTSIISADYGAKNCSSKDVKEKVQRLCLGQPICSIRVDDDTLGGGPCPTHKDLIVEAVCSDSRQTIYSALPEKIPGVFKDGSEGSSKSSSKPTDDKKSPNSDETNETARGGKAISEDDPRSKPDKDSKPSTDADKASPKNDSKATAAGETGSVPKDEKSGQPSNLPASDDSKAIKDGQKPPSVSNEQNPKDIPESLSLGMLQQLISMNGLNISDIDIAITFQACDRDNNKRISGPEITELVSRLQAHSIPIRSEQGPSTNQMGTNQTGTANPSQLNNTVPDDGQSQKLDKLINTLCNLNDELKQLLNSNVSLSQTNPNSNLLQSNETSKPNDNDTAKNDSLNEPKRNDENGLKDDSDKDSKNDNIKQPKGNSNKEPKGGNNKDPKGGNNKDPKGDNNKELKGDNNKEPKGDNKNQPKGDNGNATSSKNSDDSKDKDEDAPTRKNDADESKGKDDKQPADTQDNESKNKDEDQPKSKEDNQPKSTDANQPKSKEENDPQNADDGEPKNNDNGEPKPKSDGPQRNATDENKQKEMEFRNMMAPIQTTPPPTTAAPTPDPWESWGFKPPIFAPKDQSTVETTVSFQLANAPSTNKNDTFSTRSVVYIPTGQSRKLLCSGIISDAWFSTYWWPDSPASEHIRDEPECKQEENIALDTLKQMCLQKHDCTVTAPATTLSEKCPLDLKYVTVAYKCSMFPQPLPT